MVAIIGGETHRFRPLVDLYRKAGAEAGHPPEQLQVGIHSFGYVAASKAEAIADFYPAYTAAITKIGRERGWPPPTRTQFDAQIGKRGAIVIGDAEEVAEKILRHSEALGGITRFSFQMDVGLAHAQQMRAIELIGQKVKPLVNSGA